MAKYTEAQKKAVNKYMENKHTLRVVVTKQKAEEIQNHAHCIGESVNAYITRLIEEDMKKGKS